MKKLLTLLLTLVLSVSASAEGENTYPSFQGGDLRKFRQWVFTQIYYPKEIHKEKISGQVIASFNVNKKGKVDDIKILKSPHHILDNVVKDILKKSPRWTPAMMNGEPIDFRMTLPVSFKTH